MHINYKISKYFGAIVVVAITILYLNIQHALSILTPVSGQDVTFITLSILIAVLVFSLMVELKNIKLQMSTIAVMILSLLYSIVLPIVDLKFNGSPSGMGSFNSSIIRGMTNMIIVFCGLMSFSILKIDVAMKMAVAIFVFALLLVVFSSIEPEISYLIFTRLGEVELEYQFTLDRAGGAFFSPNLAAYSLVYSYCAIVALHGATSRVFPFSAYILLDLGLIAGVVLTGSRSGLLLAMISIAFSFLSNTRKDFRKRALMYLISLMPLAFFLNLVSPDSFGYYHPLERLLGSGASDSDASAELRSQAASQGLDLFYSNWFFGIGRFNMDALMEVTPHNAYIGSMVSFGMPGLILYLASILFLVSLSKRQLRYTIVIPAVIFVQSLFDDSVFNTKQYAYLVFIWLLINRYRLFVLQSPRRIS